MSIELGLLISLGGFILSFIATFLTQKRASKAEIEKKAGTERLIEYQLKELKEDVRKILDKVDRFDAAVDTKIDKAFEHHIKEYHREVVWTNLKTI